MRRRLAAIRHRPSISSQRARQRRGHRRLRDRGEILGPDLQQIAEYSKRRCRRRKSCQAWPKPRSTSTSRTRSSRRRGSQARRRSRRPDGDHRQHAAACRRRRRRDSFFKEGRAVPGEDAGAREPAARHRADWPAHRAFGHRAGPHRQHRHHRARARPTRCSARTGSSASACRRRRARARARRGIATTSARSSTASRCRPRCRTGCRGSRRSWTRRRRTW